MEEEIGEVLSRPVNMFYDMATGALVSVGRRRERKGHWLIVIYQSGDTYWIVIDTKCIDRIVEERARSGRWIPVW